MLFDFHHLHFHLYGNKEVKSFYLMVAIKSFANGLISVFIPIYFWELGLPLWQIFFFYFLNALFFIMIVFSLLPLIRKISDKMMIFLSIPFLVLYFLGLSIMSGATTIFYILPILLALHQVLFNIGFHLDFSGAIDSKHLGREVGLRKMMAALTGFMAPFIGGILIGLWGFQYTFLIGFTLLFLAVLPLFFVPKRTFSPNLNLGGILSYLKNKSLRPFHVSSLGYATETMIGGIVWPLFIFFSIGSIQKFGGIISIGLMAGVVVTYLAGFLSDAGQRRKVFKWATSFFSLIWVTRPFLKNIFMVVGSHVGGHILYSALIVSWISQYYKIARAVPVPGLFILSQEIIYRLIRLPFLLIIMFLAYNLDLDQFFTVSFIIAAIVSLLFLFANKLHTRDLKDGFLE